MPKLSYSFLILFFISSFHIQAKTEAEVKTALHTIAQTYIGWNTGGCFYMTPADYIKDPVSGTIIGQLYYLPKVKEYLDILLVEEGGKYNLAKVDGKIKVDLTWTNNKVSHVSAKGYYNYDYQLEYDSSGKITRLIGSQNNEVIFTYNGEQVADISSKVEYKGKSYINNFRTLEKVSPTSFEMTAKRYAKGKPMKDKFIKDRFACSCEKTGERTYDVLHGWGDKNTYKFNKEGLPEQVIVRKKSGDINTETMQYNAEGKVIRKDVLLKVGSKPKGKNVSIYELPKSLTGLDKWETKTGIYRFDAKGDMTYEARGRDYREKVNGVWGPWKKGNPCGVK